MKPTLSIYYCHPVDRKLRRVEIKHGVLMREKRLFGDASLIIVHADADSLDRHRARTTEPSSHVNVTADHVRKLYGALCGAYSRSGSYRAKCCADDVHAVLLMHASALGCPDQISTIDSVD